MVIDRRRLLVSLLAGFAAAHPVWAETERTRKFISCRRDGAGTASIAVVDAAGNEAFSTAIPARGHDATQRPFAREVVVFARRPGNWFVAIDCDRGTLLRTVHANRDRHFYGHGAFSADGRLLFATENNLLTGDGLIGIYDATGGFRRIGEFASGGIGPHDIALMPDGKSMLVANGGLRTHPDTGREALNPDDMRPSLALIDLASGSVTANINLGDGLKALSIRHLAVARDGMAVFGCQHEGAADDLPPLVGTLSREGNVRFLSAPEETLARMQNYVGSVAIDASEDIIAATSPKGNQLMMWSRRSGALLGALPMSDVSGVAAAGRNQFLASSGNAGLSRVDAGSPLIASAGPATLGWVWDNHVEWLA